ncbi:MAG: globin family protein [Pseudomonadota bacterium]
MTPEQTALIQRTFRSVPRAAAAEMFYARLFELDPSLRPLFRGDLKRQGDKLMAVLAVAVEGLGNIEAILPTVESLGARHAGYGVTSDHYEVVGRALLQTLEKSLGQGFTADVKNAWSEAYGLLSTTMIRAAGQGAPS